MLYNLRFGRARGGKYHTRQRRGDRVLEMVWSVVGWGPRRKGSRMGWEMRSEDHRVRWFLLVPE